MILVSLLQRPWRSPFPLHHEDMARRWPFMNQEVGVCQVPNQDSTLILDSAASITVRHKFSLFIKHQSMIFCHSRPDRLRQGLRLINLKKKKKKGITYPLKPKQEFLGRSEHAPCGISVSPVDCKLPGAGPLPAVFSTVSPEPSPVPGT